MAYGILFLLNVIFFSIDVSFKTVNIKQKSSVVRGRLIVFWPHTDRIKLEKLNITVTKCPFVLTMRFYLMKPIAHATINTGDDDVPIGVG